MPISLATGHPADMGEPKGELDLDEHTLTIGEVIKRYQTSIDELNPARSMGLAPREAAGRLKLCGRNEITPPAKPSAWLVFASHLLGLFNILLIISGILSFVLFALDQSSMINIYLGAILLVVALMNASIDFYQQFKTAAILESFKSLVPPGATVIRERTIVETSAAEIVTGDVIFIKSGDKIPADVRLFSVTDLKMDNSSITGEGDPQERSLTINNISNPLEAANLAFSGTIVVNGEGFGIVIRTGDRSILGQIAKLTIDEKTPESQLKREISLFVKKVAAIAIVTAIVFFILGLVLGYSIGITFSFAIGIFVAFVPQGLPVTVSTLLTIAAKRMAERNVLVKNLHAVETLGSITLLATDKTGTLTQNKMTVVGAWLNEKLFTAQEGASIDASLTPDTENLPDLISICSLCCRSKFDASEDHLAVEDRKIIGDATEVGLVRFAARYTDVPWEQEKFAKVFEVPFSSQTKWHLTVHAITHANGHFTAFIKGAPERIARMSSSIQVLPWTEETSQRFNAAYGHFAARGRRVLAMAKYPLPASAFPKDFGFARETTNIPMDQFTFTGLVALMDPPKRGVRKAVAACRTAGIQIVMVTGDHPITAEAIARQIGLVSGDTALEAAHRLKKPLELITEEEYDAAIVHGEHLDSLSDAEWDRILCKREIVFARTSPKQKLEIVTRFQNKGHIVGVSGDGVNDSPALKKADLGISMNHTASDVSKEAAAMILLDDNFPSIVNGVAEGRLIFANLKKSIRYTLVHTTPEVIAFLFFIITAFPLPISSLLILVIDLGAELGPALSYAWEPAEGDLMLVSPRKVLVSTRSKPSFPARAEAGPEMEERDLEEQHLPPPVLGDAAHAPPPHFQSRGFLATKWVQFRESFRRKDTGEVLVDSDLLLWSYLQAGLIEALGCFGAYFIVLALYNVDFGTLWRSAGTFWKPGAPPIRLADGTMANAARQTAIAGSAQSAFFLAIVICQWFNLFVTKRSHAYPYGWDMLRNHASVVGVGISAAVAFIVVYVPGLNNSLLGGGPVPALAILAPVLAGVVLIIYEFVRRFLRRKGLFGGVPQHNFNLLELVRTTSSIK